MMNNENGRSMVEMLGVLAIIGVLSVAGIAGYSMAMKKYRVNEVLNTASQLVVLAQAQGQGNGGIACTGDTCSGGLATGIAAPSGVTSMTADCTGTKCGVKLTGGSDILADAQKALNSDTANLGKGTYYDLS